MNFKDFLATMMDLFKINVKNDEHLVKFLGEKVIFQDNDLCVFNIFQTEDF